MVNTIRLADSKLREQETEVKGTEIRPGESKHFNVWAKDEELVK